MAYRVTGLSPSLYEDMFALDDAALADRSARRIVADKPSAYPCRVSLADAEPGEELLLVHHVNHDVDTPFRHGFAIYVRRGAGAAVYEDELPPMLARRTLGLRGYTAEGMLHAAALAPPGEADAPLATLLADPAIAYIDAHNAAYGCFLARVDRT